MLVLQQISLIRAGEVSSPPELVSSAIISVTLQNENGTEVPLEGTVEICLNSTRNKVRNGIGGFHELTGQSRTNV